MLWYKPIIASLAVNFNQHQETDKYHKIRGSEDQWTVCSNVFLTQASRLVKSTQLGFNKGPLSNCDWRKDVKIHESVLRDYKRVSLWCLGMLLSNYLLEWNERQLS